MTLGNTFYLEDANRNARDLGAVQLGVDYYPPTRKWHGPAIGYKTEVKPYAIHYFNEDGLEVGYWLMDLKSFHVLEQPRSWDRCMKPSLSPIPAAD